MKLLTANLRKKIPALYTQDDKGPDAIAYAKFFTPDANWTWYVTEFDGNDTCFGFVIGHEKELGYFSLSELEQLTGPLGLNIERDLYFTPKTLREIDPKHFENWSK